MPRVSGSAILAIITTVAIIMALFSIWILYQHAKDLEKFNLQYLSQNGSTKEQADQSVNIDTSWKSLDYQEIGISLKYPPDWVVAEDNILSQRFLPKKLNENGIYNIVSVTRHIGQYYSGYYDQDLFEEIYRLKKDQPFVREYSNPDNEKIFKLSAGRVKSGQRYVLFRQDSVNIQASKAREINAFILKDSYIYILSLSFYDDIGSETFEKIIASAVII